eukprot:1000-Heterococcus_DN1.PRE.9
MTMIAHELAAQVRIQTIDGYRHCMHDSSYKHYSTPLRPLALRACAYIYMVRLNAVFLPVARYIDSWISSSTTFLQLVPKLLNQVTT